MAHTTHWTGKPAFWTTWAPSLGILFLVGAHLVAAVLGLYSSAPHITLLQPLSATSHDGYVEIAAQADDGPTGSGVSKVEYQVDSTLGRWKPLSLDPRTTATYRGRWDTTNVPHGNHALYLRATDYTGNLRTIQIDVTVQPGAPSPTAEPSAQPSPDRTADASRPIVGA